MSGYFLHFVVIPLAVIFTWAPATLNEYHSVFIKHQSISGQLLFYQALCTGAHVSTLESLLDLYTIFAGLLDTNSDFFFIVFDHETGTQHANSCTVQPLTVLGNIIPEIKYLYTITALFTETDFRDIVAISVFYANPASFWKPFANNNTHALI
jgi:hypothetical protein